MAPSGVTRCISQLHRNGFKGPQRGIIQRLLSTKMHLSDFADFHVPVSLIAQAPVFPRDSSRLMVVRRDTGAIEHHHFRDLPTLLDSSYMLVANNSKVVNCKLLPIYYDSPDTQADNTSRHRREGGKVLVVYLLKQLSPSRWQVSGDDELESKSLGFEVFIDVVDPSHGGSRQIVGKLVEIDSDGILQMSFSYLDGDRDVDMKTALQSVASIPLPPYIQPENAIKVSDQSYQTVYAVEDGSVAAPTAGLHFTPEVFAGLRAKGVKRAELTLHVGYGTFGHVTVSKSTLKLSSLIGSQPITIYHIHRKMVTENDLSNHKMHSESYTLTDDVADRINQHKLKSPGNKILTVGTTSTRVLESCAQLTSKGQLTGTSSDENTFDPHYTSRFELKPGSGETNIFIYPPYKFKMVDALLTNFHMPGLTPVMLVSSFAGHQLTMKAYEEAVKEKYRFYSFGDSMLIL